MTAAAAEPAAQASLFRLRCAPPIRPVMSVEYGLLPVWEDSQAQQRFARERVTDEHLKRLLTIVEAPVELRPITDSCERRADLLMLVAEDR